MTYNDTDEREGVIGLGLGLGAAEKGKATAVSRCVCKNNGGS